MDLDDVDFLLGESVRSYKELKRELVKMVSEIKDIEERSGGRLVFDDYYASATSLLIKIRDIEREFNNNSIHAIQVQTSRRNYEEEGVIDFIAEKDEMIEKVTMFANSFNNLEDKQRAVVFYSFFKDKYNEYIAQKLFVSEQTVRILKPKAVEVLITQMKKELLIKKLQPNKSGSDDSGFFISES